MILTRIEAENVLKYRRLKLIDLPSNGQIAVSGSNEAGKTAIGETICLGLFGRTFSFGSDELDKVIRWGEYRAWVVVSFIGVDGKEYRALRQFDNTGKHHARLYLSGESQPLVEGVDLVADSIRKIIGFTFKSFVDSFYLAQREMEVPHAKSATVKALIGVDRLETVATQLETEAVASATVVEALETKIRAAREKVAEVGLDRSRLGRFESRREAKLRDAEEAEAGIAKLLTRAESMNKAAEGFVEASNMFVKSTMQTNYAQWRERKQCVAHSLLAAAKASKSSGVDLHTSWKKTGAAIKTFGEGLAEFGRVRGLANLYRERLAVLLDQRPGKRGSGPVDRAETGHGEVPFARRQVTVQDRIVDGTVRRKRLLAVAVVSVEVSFLLWVALAVLWMAPGSTLGGWIGSALAFSESGRQVMLVVGAMSASGLSGLFLVWHSRSNKQLRSDYGELEQIAKEAEVASTEMELIAAMEEASLPDALGGLRGIRNDLLHSAVVLFQEGQGAVLVQPDALATKLTQIREQSAQALRSMDEARQRVIDRAGALAKRVANLQAVAVQLQEKIAREKKRWDVVETLERGIAELGVRAKERRDEILVRTRAGELIEGACKQVYSRFLPELRRFCSKIIPHLTEARYEQIEMDDDLRVRVFSREKNGFVSLAELSNGTHRQLMLCVRLALSQALIASSSKAAQFLFFDEPFAFFDDQRVAKAIDVLRKISPQITQVFLASQEFDDPSAFDMVIDCDVDSDELQATGHKSPTKKSARRSAGKLTLTKVG